MKVSEIKFSGFQLGLNWIGFSSFEFVATRRGSGDRTEVRRHVRW